MSATLEQVRMDVAAITGKDVVVCESDGWKMSPDPNNKNGIMVEIPHGIDFITDDELFSIVHEALHGKYTDFYPDREDLKAILRKMGFPDTNLNAESLFSFFNYAEDIRIELKGGQEFFGMGKLIQVTGFNQVLEYIQMLLKAYSVRPNLDIPPMIFGGLMSLAAEHCIKLALRRDSNSVPLYNDYSDANCITSAVNLISLKLPQFEAGSLDFYTIDLVEKLRKRYKDPTLSQTLGFMKLRKELSETKSSLEGIQILADLFLTEYLALHGLQNEKSKPEDLSQQCKDVMNDPARKQRKEEEKKQEQQKKLGPNGGPSKIPQGFAGSKTDEKLQTIRVRADTVYSQSHPPTVQKGRIKVINEAANIIKRGLKTAIEHIKLTRDKEEEIGWFSRGKLDTHAIDRILSGAETVFNKTLQEVHNDRIAFEIVIDKSGSMAGNPNALDRYNAALAIGKGLAWAMKELGRPFGMTLFSNSGHNLLGYNETFSDQTIQNAVGMLGGGTRAEAGINTALTKMETLGDEEKVMFIITDGDYKPPEIGRFQDRMLAAKCTPFVILIDPNQASGPERTENLREMKEALTQAMPKCKLEAAIVGYKFEGLIKQITEYVNRLVNRVEYQIS